MRSLSITAAAAISVATILGASARAVHSYDDHLPKSSAIVSIKGFKDVPDQFRFNSDIEYSLHGKDDNDDDKTKKYKVDEYFSLIEEVFKDLSKGFEDYPKERPDDDEERIKKEDAIKKPVDLLAEVFKFPIHGRIIPGHFTEKTYNKILESLRNVAKDSNSLVDVVIDRLDGFDKTFRSQLWRQFNDLRVDTQYVEHLLRQSIGSGLGYWKELQQSLVSIRIALEPGEEESELRRRRVTSHAVKLWFNIEAV